MRAYIVHKVSEAAEGEDEKVDFLDQRPLAGPVLHLEVLAKLGRRHHKITAAWRCPGRGNLRVSPFEDGVVVLRIYAPVESGLLVCSESALVIAPIGADLREGDLGKGPVFSAKNPLTSWPTRPAPR